jgi:hypothetical protein
MSDANRGEIVYVKEATPGTTPSNPTVQVMPITSESIELSTDFVQSQIIRTDRNVANRIRTNVRAGGAIQTEFFGGKLVAPTGPYGAPDDFLRSALQAGDWSASVVHAAVNIAFNAKGANPYPTIVRASGSWVTDGYVVGRWVRPQGSSAATNNVPCKIISVSALTLEVIPGNSVSGFGDFTTVASTSGVTVTQGSEVKNGVVFDSYSLQKRFSDLANTTWERLLGAGINGFEIRSSLNSIIGISFDLTALIAESGVFAGTVTDVAASTQQPYNVVDDVKAVMQWTASAYSSIAGVTSMNISVGNSLRARNQFATLGAISLGSGTFVSTASFDAYYDATTAAMWAVYRAAGEINLAFVLDNGTRAYAVETPKNKITAASRLIQGLNQDVFLRVETGAYINAAATELNTMRIVRW